MRSIVGWAWIVGAFVLAPVLLIADEKVRAWWHGRRRRARGITPYPMRRAR